MTRKLAGYTDRLDGAQNTYEQSGGTAGTLRTTIAPAGTLLSLQTAGLTYWYALDTRGSVRALVPSTGAVPEATYGYDPYGITTPGGPNTVLAQNNPYRYLGSYQDTQGTDHGTRLYKLGLRYYDPTQGRFTQQDSIESPGDLASGNRYSYAAQDPVNGSDPTGEFCVLGHNENGGCRGAGVAKAVGNGVTRFLIGGGAGAVAGFTGGAVASIFSGPLAPGVLVGATVGTATAGCFTGIAAPALGSAYERYA